MRSLRIPANREMLLQTAQNGTGGTPVLPSPGRLFSNPDGVVFLFHADSTEDIRGPSGEIGERFVNSTLCV